MRSNPADARPNRIANSLPTSVELFSPDHLNRHPDVSKLPVCDLFLAALKVLDILKFNAFSRVRKNMRGYFYYDSSSPVFPGTVERSSDYMVVIQHESVSEICTKVIPAKIKEFGPYRFSWLEIHSHGESGKILLGSDGVTSANVGAFGTALRSYMRPNGVIEVLACLVASGKVSLSSRLQMQMEVKKLAIGVTHGMSRHAPAKARYMDALYQIIYADPALRQQHAGMMLCSKLAITSGCTVRAGGWVQVEEDSRGSENMTRFERKRHRSRRYSAGPVPTQPRESEGYEYEEKMFTEFGHWEGPVYDFLPGGGLKYLGEGLKRHTPYRVLHTGSSNFA